MEPRVRDLLARQDGVITRRQALDAGLSSSAVGRLVASGQWRALHAGVYMPTDRAMTPRAWLRATAAAVGPGCVVAGEAAAWWLGAGRKPVTTPTVVLPPGRHCRAEVTATVVQRALLAEDVVVRDRLRVEALPAALLDAAALEGAVDLLDRALLRRLVTMEDVTAAHERYPRRRGAAAAARIVAAAAGGARSEAERRAHGLLRRAHVTGWEANVDVAGNVGDIVFEAARVIVEVDGFAFHSDPQAFQRDRERRNALVAAGWTILHFTWWDVTERPGYVVASIRHAIRGDSSRLAGETA